MRTRNGKENKNKNLIDWRKNAKTTKTDWKKKKKKKKKKKEEYRLFLGLNNSFRGFLIVSHSFTFLHTGHFTPFFFFSVEDKGEEGDEDEEEEEGEHEEEGGDGREEEVVDGF